MWIFGKLIVKRRIGAREPSLSARHVSSPKEIEARLPISFLAGKLLLHFGVGGILANGQPRRAGAGEEFFAEGGVVGAGEGGSGGGEDEAGGAEVVGEEVAGGAGGGGGGGGVLGGEVAGGVVEEEGLAGGGGGFEDAAVFGVVGGPAKRSDLAAPVRRARLRWSGSEAGCGFARHVPVGVGAGFSSAATSRPHWGVAGLGHAHLKMHAA